MQAKRGLTQTFSPSCLRPPTPSPASPAPRAVRKSLSLRHRPWPRPLRLRQRCWRPPGTRPLRGKMISRRFSCKPKNVFPTSSGSSRTAATHRTAQSRRSGDTKVRLVPHAGQRPARCSSTCSTRSSTSVPSSDARVRYMALHCTVDAVCCLLHAVYSSIQRCFVATRHTFGHQVQRDLLIRVQIAHLPFVTVSSNRLRSCSSQFPAEIFQPQTSWNDLPEPLVYLPNPVVTCPVCGLVGHWGRLWANITLAVPLSSRDLSCPIRRNWKHLATSDRGKSNTVLQ